MDYETVSAADFGTSLRGLGLNILVCDVIAQAEFLSAVFDMKAHRVSGDFAIMTYGDQVFQIHSDGTYHSHPLLSLRPEAGARGGGAQFHLFATDPDVAASKADAMVVISCKNQPINRIVCARSVFFARMDMLG